MKVVTNLLLASQGELGLVLGLSQNMNDAWNPEITILFLQVFISRIIYEKSTTNEVASIFRTITIDRPSLVHDHDMLDPPR